MIEKLFSSGLLGSKGTEVDMTTTLITLITLKKNG
jgi:hypothetical protein